MTSRPVRRRRGAASSADRAVSELAHALREARTGLTHVPDVLEGVLEDAADRRHSVVDVLGGRRRRRWPWTAGAAAAGAAAGAGAVLLLRRLVGQDAPDALEPEELQAVVDPGPDAPAGPLL